MQCFKPWTQWDDAKIKNTCSVFLLRISSPPCIQFSIHRLSSRTCLVKICCNQNIYQTSISDDILLSISSFSFLPFVPIVLTTTLYPYRPSLRFFFRSFLVHISFHLHSLYSHISFSLSPSLPPNHSVLTLHFSFPLLRPSISTYFLPQSPYDVYRNPEDTIQKL